MPHAHSPFSCCLNKPMAVPYTKNLNCDPRRKDATACNGVVHRSAWTGTAHAMRTAVVLSLIVPCLSMPGTEATMDVSEEAILQELLQEPYIRAEEQKKVAESRAIYRDSHVGFPDPSHQLSMHLHPDQKHLFHKLPAKERAAHEMELVYYVDAVRPPRVDSAGGAEWCDLSGRNPGQCARWIQANAVPAGADRGAFKTTSELGGAVDFSGYNGLFRAVGVEGFPKGDGSESFT